MSIHGEGEMMKNLASAMETPDSALFVDLDGTLVATDIFAELLLKSIKHHPTALAKELVHGASRGPAQLKRAVAELMTLDPSQLPYRKDVLDFIKEERCRGRYVVLATASDVAWARTVAQYLDLFDDVIASDGQHNLKGKAKLEAIEDYCQRHGFREFAYVGDAVADLPIWRRAAHVYVVNPTTSLLQSLKQLDAPVQVLGEEPFPTAALVRALRPQQWAKNALLFLPVVLAHDLFDIGRLAAAFLAFIAFSLCASAVYVVNDLLDVDADRLHPLKRHRPFASGALPIGMGPPLACSLLAVGLTLSMLLLPWLFVETLVLYLIATTAYSFWLKREALIDVLLLAGLYTLRLVAGGAATTVPISEWLLAFSMFFFTSLAFVKRYAELARLSDEGQTAARGRGYMVADLGLIETMGPTLGYLSVLVFALYLNSETTKQLYPSAHVLWFICPFLLYWIGRVWLLAKRRQLAEDPVVFAMKDRTSLMLGIMVVVLGMMAAVWR
jgi:4-hydroxybenzoate polyprenyltransferase/phosphoserine phosphatase